MEFRNTMTIQLIKPSYAHTSNLNGGKSVAIITYMYWAEFKSYFQYFVTTFNGWYHTVHNITVYIDRSPR